MRGVVRHVRRGGGLGAGAPAVHAAAHAAGTRGSCADEAEYGCAARAAGGECDSDKANMLYRCPRACGVCGFIRIVDEAFGCDDANPSCRQWADAGECAANPGYMHENCATACGSCEQKRRACNRPPDTPPAVGPGDIDATYRRIMSDFPQYSPRALSRPGDARFVARNSARFGALLAQFGAIILRRRILYRYEKRPGDEAPWVVTFEKFISDDEIAAFISGCEAHFDRSLAGDQLSPVRTSFQCWCSKNECERHPLTKIVEERIANVTRIPVRYAAQFWRAILAQSRAILPRGHASTQVHGALPGGALRGGPVLPRPPRPELGAIHAAGPAHPTPHAAHHAHRPSHVVPPPSISHVSRETGLWHAAQGARVYTFFMYLSTPAAGGGTKFNDLGVVVPAVKGSAVMWPSISNRDPSRDEPQTNHEALPVEDGMKYASNVWLHMYDYRTPADAGCLLTHKNTH